MKVLLFGATGMVGQGVLRECLLDPDVERVQSVGRSPTGIHHPKLREIVHRDLSHYAEIEAELSGFDACFFSLGVSSAGMKAEDYERITYGITMAAADEILLRLGYGYRQYRAGQEHVGAGQGKNRKRAPALTVCRRVHVSPRPDRADARREAEGHCLSSLLHHRQTTPGLAPAHFSQSRPDHGGNWKGYADRSPAWLPQTYPRNQGYSRRPPDLLS
jgi:hypothetical protein